MGALEDVRDLAEAVVRRRSLRLWDVEMMGRPGSSVVRVYIDADDGVDIDTVAEVSEEISRGLDLKDPIPGRYTLEVSSPGLERTLKTLEHFERSVGRKVVVKTKDVVHGSSHRVDGVITGAAGDKVQLDAGGEKVEIDLDDIRSARTVFEWNSN